MIYLLGYISTFLVIKNNKKDFFKYKLIEKLAIISVILIPLGKLFYFHIPGMYGLKFSFIYICFFVTFCLLFSKFNRKIISFYLFLIIIILSLTRLDDFGMLFLYKIGEAQTDSVLLRVVTIYMLSLYCYFLSELFKKNPELFFFSANMYIKSLLYACLCGGILFMLILKGTIGEAQISSLTSGAHIIKFGPLNIFRFNPGANVNEFSYILGIGILLLNFTNIETKKKNIILFVFLICIFLTLTRAAWLSLVVAYIIFFLVNKKSSKKIRNAIIFSLCFFSLFAYIYSTVESFSYLVDSRLTLTIGASGDERLEKFDFAYQSLLDSKLTLLFGHGWSTNMYIHNVYLQLIYELGIVGFIIFSAYIIYIILPAFFVKERYYKSTLIALMTFIFLFAIMQHTLYHTQTWFVLAILNSSIILNKKSKPFYSNPAKKLNKTRTEN